MEKMKFCVIYSHIKSLKGLGDWQRATAQGLEWGRALCSTGRWQHLWKWFLCFTNELPAETNLSAGLAGEVLPKLLTSQRALGKTAQKNCPHYFLTQRASQRSCLLRREVNSHPCSTESQTFMCAGNGFIPWARWHLGSAKALGNSPVPRFPSLMYCWGTMSSINGKAKRFVFISHTHKRSLWSCPSGANKLPIWEAHG